MTRDEAIAAAGHELAVAQTQRATKTLRQAAQDAVRPGGPSAAEIERRLRSLATRPTRVAS